MPNNEDECIPPQVLVVASCDSSGITYVNEDTRLNLDDNGLVEISYINIPEDVVVTDIGLLDSVNNEDDSSRQSSELCFEIEDTIDSFEISNHVDVEQVAITNDFLSGKITFKDFISKVECSEEDQSSLEELSDSEEENILDCRTKDPDFIPTCSRFKASKCNFNQSKQRDSIVEGASSVSSFVTGPSYQENVTQSLRKRKNSTPRVMRKLPPNLLGNVIKHFKLKKFSHKYFSKGLMGEANLRYARNEKQDAINLCMEVIRQVNTNALALII